MTTEEILDFKRSRGFSVGVELELQILNSRDYNLARDAADLLALLEKTPHPGAVKPEPPVSKPEPPRLQLPDEADLNKVVGFMEKVWRRLVEMIAALQKEIQKKS